MKQMPPSRSPGRARRRDAPHPKESVHRTLIRAFGLLRRAMAPHFARFGISGAQFGVLRALDRAHADGGAPLRLSDLSARLLVQPPSVTGVVGRLRRMGLVATSVSRADQRAREVRLTAAGRRRVAQILARHPARVKQILAGLTAAEQHQLHGLLERLATHLETHLAMIGAPGVESGGGAS
jgi:DNA-binding MarR family transcriptional regulator